MRLLIVEDHPLLAETLAIALRMHGSTVEVVQPASDDEVVVAARAMAPDLVLLDLDLGLAVNPGHRHVAALCETGANVLIVTGSRDLCGIALAIEAGAIGYVGKDQPFDDLIDHVRRAMAGEEVLPPEERTRLLLHLRTHRSGEHAKLRAFTTLTRREQEVLAELMQGKTVDEIASGAVVSLNTVRTQVRQIREKLGVGSQLAAVVLAHSAGWEPPA